MYDAQRKLVKSVQSRDLGRPKKFTVNQKNDVLVRITNEPQLITG